MDIVTTQCESFNCDEVWPHNHILPMSEILEFHSWEAGGCIAQHVEYIRYKSDDSWFGPLKRKLDAEGFFGGIRISRDLGGGTVHDGHHRLLICMDSGQYWCPVTNNDQIVYDYPDEWGADDYDWVSENSWERSGGL